MKSLKLIGTGQGCFGYAVMIERDVWRCLLWCYCAASELGMGLIFV